MSSKSPGPKRKTLIIKILMLDDSEIPFQIESKTTGNELINLVYQYLKLVESDYFGLEFIDSKGKKNWLDYDKPVAKQIQNNLKLIFCVKFYTPDPGQLEEEYTRYLYALQIKRDLAEGLLLCTDATASLLASYILQAEIGDFTENFNPNIFFQNKKFFPHQNADHEIKIIDYYKNHIGKTPADADMNLLDIARKIELYGIIMHPARDHEGVQLNLAVAHMGILVFQNFTKINTFSWAKIRKLSFKRKKFLVKLHPENYGFYKDTVEFYFDHRDDSKNFWKKCIEHHAFFRCISAQRMPRQKSKLLTRGSSFRYYGRTQKELIENARESLAKNRSFDRSYHSMRNISHYNYSGSSGAINFHAQGTQSLNRNLASRSTGAILQPGYATTGHGSTNFISSTDSVNLYSSNQHPEYNERNLDSRHSLGKEKALGLSDCDDQSTDEDCDEDKNEEKNDTSTFKPQIVSLPIQQEKKADIERPNPNKIYSRKEVIQTTYKEEFLHTTTTTTNLYSADKLSPSSSSPSSSSSNQNQEAHEDDDEDADKKARCSLAAQIILSNMKKQNEQQKIRAYERIRRPISPIRTEPSFAYRPTVKQNIKPRKDISSPNPILPVHLNQQIVIQDYQQPVIRPAINSIKKESLNAQPVQRRPQIQETEAFSILKELVMTERTYKKNLELVTILFRQFTEKQNFSLTNLDLFDLLYSDQALLPLAEFHSKFLNDLETRFHAWTDKSIENTPTSLVLGDLLMTLEQSFKFYTFYIQKYDLILNELEQLCKKNKKFDAIYKEFESLKICYLPFSFFLFKPIQRVIHYKILIERLLISYGVKHPDYAQAYNILEKLDGLNDFISEKILAYENTQKLLELEKDIINFSHETDSKRKFLREGSLQKLSRKGYQQRMFFLFDDTLLYCAKCSTSSGLLFKVHGEFPLRNIQIEDGNAHISVENSFTVHCSKRSMLLCAVNADEKLKWIQDLYESVEKVKNSELISSTSPKLHDQKSNYSTLKSNSSSDNNLDLSNEEDQVQTNNAQHRANTTMHVCWHRNTSVSANDIHRSNLNQLSGYLLRKFKNSNGWQKLWVVFTNFCLFFYKTYQDEYPLASLPLLGYSVTVPSESDNINKDFVFKLQFKNHVYFFRAESQYSFDRWLEVTESAVQKKCLFNMND